MPLCGCVVSAVGLLPGLQVHLDSATTSRFGEACVGCVYLAPTGSQGLHSLALGPAAPSPLLLSSLVEPWSEKREGQRGKLVARSRGRCTMGSSRASSSGWGQHLFPFGSCPETQGFGGRVALSRPQLWLLLPPGTQKASSGRVNWVCARPPGPAPDQQTGLGLAEGSY